MKIRLSKLIAPCLVVFFFTILGLLIVLRFETIFGDFLGTETLPFTTKLLFDYGSGGLVFGGLICAVMIYWGEFCPNGNWLRLAGIALGGLLIIAVVVSLHAPMDAMIQVVGEE